MRMKLKKKGAAMVEDMAANYSHRTALRFIFFYLLKKKG